MSGEILTDGVITLREITAADIPLLYAWRNHPETLSMFRDDRPLNFEAHGRFLRQYLEDPRGDYWWIVEAAGVPVGTICLFHFGAGRRSCEFGRFIVAPEYRGSGYGRRALALAMSVARSLGVERMSCVALSSNARALRLYGSLGFAFRGIDAAGGRSFAVLEAALNQPTGMPGRT